MNNNYDENHKAKLEFIRAFFDDLDAKIAFLDDLHKKGHRDEAQVLCACYIDWLSSALYWPEECNNFNFVRVLKEHGGEDIFSYIHPKMLEDSLHKKINRNPSKPNRKWAEIIRKVSPALQRAQVRFYKDLEIVDLLTPLANSSEIEAIKNELWRGTFAAIVYYQFRIPSVHGLGPSDGITFDKSTFKGKPVLAIEFSMMKDCLKRIAHIARQITVSTGKWFGHDYK